MHFYFLRGLGFSPYVQTAIVLLACLLFFTPKASAVQIHFPDEELASESVLPLIDPVQMVLDRNIPLKRRFEIGLGTGYGMDEPFYFSFYPNGMIAFHITELHSVNLTGTYFLSRLSSAGRALQSGQGLDEGQTFDPLKAPYPQMSVFLNYQYTPFYGKISVAKHIVMNLSIYVFSGLGLIVSDQNDQWPGVNLGIGQKFYLNKWLGIRGDLGFYGYYGPATARLDLGGNRSKVQYKELQPTEKSININITANIGVIFLI